MSYDSATARNPKYFTSPDLAQAVLLDWLQGRSTLEVPFLKPEHFHDHRDQVVWRACMQLSDEGVLGEPTALIERCRRVSTLESSIDWNGYVYNIYFHATHSSIFSFETNARTIYENWRRNEIIAEATRQVRRAANLTIPLPPDPEQLAAERLSKRLSAGRILDTEFPNPGGPWPGIIPTGLTLIGARPKYGKSLLMLQVSAAVGTGGLLFNHPVPARRVLYYALEDSFRRLKDRLARLRVPAEAQIDFARSVEPLQRGGLAEVGVAAADYGLIIIDTISRAMPGADFNRDAALYGDVLGRLQQVATDANMSIVTVVHTRKPSGLDRDPIDDVIGTTQITAVADCVLALYRQDGRTLLQGRSRDLGEIDLTMQLDPASVTWQLVGQTDEVRQTENEREILAAVAQLVKAKASAIARMVNANRGNTSARLQKLWVKGLITKELIDDIPYYSLRNLSTNRS